MSRATNHAIATMAAIMTDEVMAAAVADTRRVTAIKAANAMRCAKTEDAAADDSAAMTTPMQAQHHHPRHTLSAPRKRQ